MINEYQLLDTVIIEKKPSPPQSNRIFKGSHDFKAFKPSVFDGFQPNENFISIKVASLLSNNGQILELTTETRLRVETPMGFNLKERLTNENSTDLLTRMFLTAQQEHNNKIKHEIRNTIFDSIELKYESPKYFNNLIKESLSVLFN